MKNLNSQEMGEISEACRMVRFSMVLFFATKALQNREINIAHVPNLAGNGSEIYDLVESGSYENLFKDENWLNLLAVAEGVNVLVDGMLTEFLTTIYKYFPNETKGYLVPRI